MMRNDGFEQVVADWLHERADWTAPSYLDEVLVQTRRTRQRPWWSGLDRWLPGGWAAPEIPGLRIGRLVVVLALVAALVATAVYVGSRPRRPPPFGPAGNGVILYGAGDGDLYTLDIVTGATIPIVTGGPDDETPEFSHDGSRFVFARKAESAGRWILMVANADGTNARPLTGPVDPQWNAWSPDDTQVAVVDAAGTPTLTLYQLAGGAPLTLDIRGRLATNAAFVPDGSAIVFLGSTSRSFGIYAIATAGTSAPRTIVTPVPAETIITNPILSPDGATVAYTRWEAAHSAIHLVDVATGDDHAVKLDPTSAGENTAAWSPDGSRLLFHRHGGGSYQLAVSTVTGGPVSLIGPIVPEGTGGADAVFSPDGRMVIARYEHDGSLWLLETTGGPGRELEIDASAVITWQRVVP